MASKPFSTECPWCGRRFTGDAEVTSESYRREQAYARLDDHIDETPACAQAQRQAW